MTVSYAECDLLDISVVFQVVLQCRGIFDCSLSLSEFKHVWLVFLYADDPLIRQDNCKIQGWVLRMFCCQVLKQQILQLKLRSIWSTKWSKSKPQFQHACYVSQTMQERKKNRFLLNIQYCLVADIEHLNLQPMKNRRNKRSNMEREIFNNYVNCPSQWINFVFLTCRVLFLDHPVLSFGCQCSITTGV